MSEASSEMLPTSYGTPSVLLLNEMLSHVKWLITIQQLLACQKYRCKGLLKSCFINKRRFKGNRMPSALLFYF